MNTTVKGCYLLKSLDICYNSNVAMRVGSIEGQDMTIKDLAKWFLIKNPTLRDGYIDENTKLNKLYILLLIRDRYPTFQKYSLSGFDLLQHNT